MSAFVYGSTIRENQQKRDDAVADAGTNAADAAAANDAPAENKLLTTIAGLVPVEVVAAHGLILGFTTKANDDGTTVITQSGLLQWSLPILVVAAVLLFVVGRGLSPRWAWRDYVRLFIPPLAVVVWLGLIGTSALTPWATQYDWAPAVLGVGAVAVGLALVILSQAVADPKR